MNPSRKGCLKPTISALLFFAQLYASPPQPPQPRFDLYLLPPAPPQKIVEYPILDPSGDKVPIRTEPEAVSEQSMPRESANRKDEEKSPQAETKAKAEADRTAPSEDKTTPDSGDTALSEEDSMKDVASEVYARLNERFSLALEGGSWLFIEAYPSGGIAYDGRLREARFTRFSFRAQKKGRYILQFVQGSSGGGSGSRHRVAVEVLSPDEFAARVTGESAPSGPGKEGSLPSEEEMELELSMEERYRAALEHMKKEEWQDAFMLLTDSKEFDPAIPSHVTAAVFASALFMDDYMLALDFAGFTASRQKDFIDSILNLGRDLSVELRRRLLVASLELLPAYHGMDELVFALARDYEESGPARDIADAVRWYRYLTSEYPLSAYWQKAEERANYLERHFLLVR